mmetsp:Transcript_126094/g.251785  ORF Transcript_126094/g.251785 Transcript_126094/m.251785 type:complete len:553 (-) Transcript_126094:86-1744(-)|eukprot:CAMPEP_0172710368 /NCGR_PEP_ID=MMETSP1074-20121228/55617_1 /TAXON_ID=2916 /ORGANISM="Ceratium fusus, Strain PA161109" /LENGTH=552 /DNA_ID=CAMNT_0013533757 /DNA_START=94 /DNA_END=1752 /DNA_ORIENTATION=+
MPATKHHLLTRADVRDEVEAALSTFTKTIFRHELDRLTDIMRQTIQDSMSEALEEALPELEGGLVQPKDLRSALDSWWAGSKGTDTPKFQMWPQVCNDSKPRQPEMGAGWSPSTMASTNMSTTSPTWSPMPITIAPSTPESLEDLESSSFTTVLSPCTSPLMLPVSPMSAVSSNRKDWRRTFVEKATKANRKIEYLDGGHVRTTHEINEVVEESLKALEDGMVPHLVEDGLGGTYFVRDRAGKSIAVFKPRDEEPLAPNNPKVHTGRGGGTGLKEGVLVGEAAINEYAAYLVDQVSSPLLQAGVCPTALVRIANSVFHSAEEDRHSAFHVVKDKVGSFQLFAQHDCTSEDIGPARFPTDQVHRIAALDIRLCNTDRHSGNVLIREIGGEVMDMVPIDHGYALPGDVGTDLTLEWISWKAAKHPFSEAICQEILAIDPEVVEAMLKKRVPSIRPECLATLYTCTRLLQNGVKAGLTAFHIGQLMIRPWCASEETQEPSVLESLVADARKRTAKDGIEDLVVQRQLLEDLLKAKCEEVAKEIMEPAKNEEVGNR